MTGLNAAEESYGSAITKGDVKEQIKLQSALKFNGGGQSAFNELRLPLLPRPFGSHPIGRRGLCNNILTRPFLHHSLCSALVGHINHSLFWKNLAPAGSTKLADGGALKKAIEKTFGSVAGQS